MEPLPVGLCCAPVLGTAGGLELVSLVGEKLDWTLEETCSAVRVSCSECENMTLNRTLGIEIAYPFLHAS